MQAVLVNDLSGRRSVRIVGWTIVGLLFFWLQGKLIRLQIAAEAPPPEQKHIFCQIDHFEFLPEPLSPECVAFLKKNGIVVTPMPMTTARQR